MFGGLSLGARRSHIRSHATVNVSFLFPCALNLVRKSVRHLAAMSIRPRPPLSVWRCRVDRGTRRIAAFRRYHMAVASCLTCSFGIGKSCAVCHILASKSVCTYWIRCVRQVSSIHIPRQCTYLSRHPRPTGIPGLGCWARKMYGQNVYARAVGNAHYVNRRVPWASPHCFGYPYV